MRTNSDDRLGEAGPRERDCGARRPGRRGAERVQHGRAIVVDDDVLIRRMLSEALEARGFEVLDAGDGVAGLQLLSETILGVDVLVTDVLMPGLNGLEFVRTIRTAGGESELCIVAVTASEDPLRRTMLLDAGVDLVLRKDLGPAGISVAVEAAVLGSRAKRRRLASM